MTIETSDISKLATLLSQLAQNYNELAQNWFDIFYNPEPIERKTLKFFDTDGNLIEYELPNRAYDLHLIKNGEGTPDNNLDASVGTIYQDVLNGHLYIKQSDQTDQNWRRIMSMNEVYSTGNDNPNGWKEGSRGDMFMDLSKGQLWLKTTETGNEGWELSGAGGKADKIDVDRRFAQVDIDLDTLKREIEDGVVHKRGNKEIILSEKEFQNKVKFTDECNFTKVIMGTAYRALSADIAEYYEADEKLKPGTLVQFGGEKEITKAVNVVNAVVSTNPAYILNGENNMEHPTLIALSGRIPVRVKGPVNKFDYITLSEEAGVAIVDNSEKLCYNRIGRALETNLDEGEKLVECVVKLEL